MLLKIFLIAALSLADTDQTSLKGRLCWSSTTQCVDTSGTTVTVDRSSAPRVYVWSSADGARVVLGELPAGAEKIDLAAAQVRPLSLSLTGDRSRGWPDEAHVKIVRGKVSMWDWKIAADEVKKLREIALPAGDFVIFVTAPHHKAARRTVTGAEAVKLGQITLEPLPMVHGRTLQRHGDEQVPVAGVQIVRSDGKVAGVTAADGTFRVELGEPLPYELLLIPTGLASHAIPLKNVPPSLDAGDILLESGSRLVLRVTRPAEGAEALRVRIMRSSKQKYEPVPFRTYDLPLGEEQLVIPDLARGKYHVVIEGDDELERLEKVVEVDADEEEESLSIEPYRVSGRVKFGSEPLASGSVGVSSRGWRVKLPLDDEGRFGGTLWQHGKLHGFITSEELGTPLPVESPALGADPSEWNIQLKRRVIEGRVTDAATGEPLSKVDMFLQLTSGEGKESSRLNTNIAVDAAGGYRIAAVRDGIYDIEVRHPSRVPTRRTVELAPADETRQIDFKLEEGVRRTVEVTWPDGRAVAGANVMEGVARDGHNAQRYYSTDGSGRLTIAIAQGETRTLYILPKEGSFAVARLAPGGDEKTSRVVVPPPAGSLRIEMRNASGELVRAMPLLRLNGEWLPYAIVSRLRSDSLAPGVTRLLALPAGTYEVWGVQAGFHKGAALAAPPPLDPVRVGVAGGEQTARVTAYDARPQTAP